VGDVEPRFDPEHVEAPIPVPGAVAPRVVVAAGCVAVVLALPVARRGVAVDGSPQHPVSGELAVVRNGERVAPDAKPVAWAGIEVGVRSEDRVGEADVRCVRQLIVDAELDAQHVVLTQVEDHLAGGVRLLEEQPADVRGLAAEQADECAGALPRPP
jgi:hypothetical protein